MKTATNSQVVFTIDSKTKARAMERARAQGVPFASVLKLATKAFADGDFSMGIVETVRPEKLRVYERQSNAISAGKGRSFASAKDAQNFLRSL